MSETKGRAFAAIARTWEPKTISIYAAKGATRQYSLADVIFEVSNGEAMLPDVLGRQLELQRLRRHPQLEAFTVSESGELSFVFYPGQSFEDVAAREKARLEAERVAALEAGQISPELQAAIDELHDVLTAPPGAAGAPESGAAAQGAESPTPTPIAPQGAAPAAPGPVSTSEPKTGGKPRGGRGR